MYRVIQSSYNSLKRQSSQAGLNQKLEGLSLQSPMSAFLSKCVCVCVFCLIALLHGKQPEVEEMFFDIFFLPTLFEYVHYAIFPLKF